MLVVKLVPVVAIHLLEGSRANRHHTPNPQPGAAQPSYAQSTRVAFNAPPEKAQEPLISSMIEADNNHQ